MDNSIFSNVIYLALSILLIVALWKIFEKAGQPGWASIIPFYNVYVLFEIAWGSGIKFLWLLVPFANIYFIIMVYIKLAHSFGKSTLFGIGLLLLNPIFLAILGFSDAQYIGPQV